MPFLLDTFQVFFFKKLNWYFVVIKMFTCNHDIDDPDKLFVSVTYSSWSNIFILQYIMSIGLNASISESCIYHIRSIGENGTYDEIGWRKAASLDKAEITHMSTHHTSLTILWKWPALWVIVCTCHTPQTILWIGMTRLWVIGDSQRVVFATNISVWHLFSKKRK